MQVKVKGVWKQSKPYVKLNGVWKEVKVGWVKQQGVWVKFYTST